MLNIGLDFDDTYTSAPDLFAGFVNIATKMGHVVFITTARAHVNIADIEKAFPNLEIITSNGKPKRPAAEEYGVTIDIWIDDMPEIIPGELDWKLSKC